MAVRSRYDQHRPTILDLWRSLSEQNRERCCAGFCAAPPDDLTTLADILASVEREAIADAMARYGTQQEAARALGVNQSTIARKLKKYALSVS